MRDYTLQEAVTALRAGTAETEMHVTNWVDWLRGDPALVSSFIEALKTNTTVTKLDMDNIVDEQSGEAFGIALASVLKTNSTLRSIHLRGNFIGDSASISLAQALEANSSLQDFTYQCNQVHAEGAKAFAAALQKNAHLETLDLGVNRIGIEGIKALSEALMSNSSLKQLDLRMCSIGDVGVLAEGLKKNYSLLSLNLTSNAIDDNAAKILAKWLAKNRYLTNLFLAGNQINDEGIKAIAKALENNDSVKVLDVSLNEFGIEGLKAITKALENNDSVKVLDVSLNEFGIEGLKAINNLLKVNRFITSIGKNIFNDFLDEEGEKIKKEIKASLAFNCKLPEFIIERSIALAQFGNLMTPIIAKEIVAFSLESGVLVLPKKLENLIENVVNSVQRIQYTRSDLQQPIPQGIAADLPSPQFTNQDRKNLALLFKGNEGILHDIMTNSPSLTSLSFQNQNMGNTVFNSLVKALANNSHITTLNLYSNQITKIPSQFKELKIERLCIINNRIGDKGAKELADNPNIKTLLAGNCDIQDRGKFILSKAGKEVSYDVVDPRVTTQYSASDMAGPSLAPVEKAPESVNSDSASKKSM